MFGDKLAAAQKQILSLTALIASTGFKIEAGVEPSVEAFKAHLDAQTKSAVDAALAPIAAQAATSAAEAAGFRAGILAAGVKLGEFKAEDFTAGAGKTAADSVAATSIKTAIETSVAAKSAKQIAASGHPHALPIASGEDETEAKSAAELRKEFDGITDSKERAAFYAKHSKKLLR